MGQCHAREWWWLRGSWDCLAQGSQSSGGTAGPWPPARHRTEPVLSLGASHPHAVWDRAAALLWPLCQLLAIRSTASGRVVLLTLEECRLMFRTPLWAWNGADGCRSERRKVFQTLVRAEPFLLPCRMAFLPLFWLCPAASVDKQRAIEA